MVVVLGSFGRTMYFQKCVNYGEGTRPAMYVQRGGIGARV